MKQTIFMPLMALLVLFAASAPVVAEESMDEMDKRCRSYAVEDGVPADELDSYIKECIDDILRENADTASEADPGPESEENRE